MYKIKAGFKTKMTYIVLLNFSQCRHLSIDQYYSFVINYRVANDRMVLGDSEFSSSRVTCLYT